MSEPLVNVITPATEVGLISVADLKILLAVPAEDTSSDAQLQMLIDQNSMVLAKRANRDTFAKEKVEERWDCLAMECCPEGTRKIWLTRAPVKPADIESVLSPDGTIIPPSGYRLEQSTGKMIFLYGADEILITYSGGYDLPEEAPLDLRMMARLMVQQTQAQAAQAATGGSGIRMLAHKDSRIMYYSPKDLAGGGSGGGGASSTASATEQAIDNLIRPYTRLWI